MKAKDYNYLIVGGAPKSGTTSLYKYLSIHPEIFPSNLKETRFFLEKDNPSPSASRFDKYNLEEYNKFFLQTKITPNKIRMEATPDYLYSKTALHMMELLPKAKIIFILRDPVDRLLSWYKYALQKGMLKHSVSFDEYIQMQVDITVNTDTPQHLQALEQGRYSKYIDLFSDKYEQRILILSFDEFKKNPSNTMKTICEFSGIDDKIYDNYVFTIENPSSNPRFHYLYIKYIGIRRELAYIFHAKPIIKNILKVPNNWIKTLLRLSNKEHKHISLSTSTIKTIHKYSQK